MHRTLLFSLSLAGVTEFDLPSTMFSEFDNMESSTTTNTSDKMDNPLPVYVAPVEVDLTSLMNAANEAEREVVDMLEKKIKAEKVFSKSEREYIIDSTNNGKKTIMEANREVLTTARSALLNAKVKASEARGAYSERVAKVTSKGDDLSM